jgi:chemotaxis signal transduction protein
LLFVCAGVPCAAPLAELREALPTLPRTTPLPFSPPWLLGLFPLRTEIIGLVDPVPMLTGAGAGRAATEPRPDPWNTARGWAADAQSALAAVGAQAEPWRWGAASGMGAALGVPLGTDVFGISGPRGGAAGGTLFTPGGVPAALTRAMLVGDGARSLALVVDALGAIARAQDDEIAHAPTSFPAPLPFAARYVAGVYTPVDDQRHFVVLQITTLLDDLLDALEQPEERRHDA